jgi:type IV secretory pathway TrbL component
MPQVDLVRPVERYFDLVQRTVDINRRLAVRWAEAAGTLPGVVREKAESAGDVVRDKAEAAGDIAREQAVKAERAAREQAAKIDQAEKELARQARQAGTRKGPPALRRPDQGPAERPAGPAGPLQDRQRRRAHRAPRRGRQQVMPHHPQDAGADSNCCFGPAPPGGAAVAAQSRRPLSRPTP